MDLRVTFLYFMNVAVQSLKTVHPIVSVLKMFKVTTPSQNQSHFCWFESTYVNVMDSLHSPLDTFKNKNKSKISR